MPAPANLVRMTTTTTGTGPFTVAAVNGNQDLATAFGTGGTDVFDVFISNQAAAEWMRATAHMSSSTNLVIDTVLEGTNGTSLVNFSAGTKDVFNDVPAAKQVTTDTAQTLLNKTLINPAISAINGGPIAGFRNRLINSSGMIAQVTFAATADAGYVFDQWYVLTQSNPVTPSQLTLVENGTPYMMRITQANASAQRFGIAQPIEAQFCQNLRGSPVTLSARVRCSASTTLRYAIVEWTGTADTIAKDVVNDWTSGTFTTGNFFTSTTTTVTATGSIALTANTLTDITALTGTVSSSMNNLIVFFWTDSTQAQNVTLDIGKVQLEQGSTATPHEWHRASDELNACQRYFWVWSGAAAVSIPVALCYSQSTTSARAVQTYPTTMRIAPTVSYSAAGDFQVSFATGFTPSAISASPIGTMSAFHVATCSGLTASLAGVLRNSSTSAAILFDARL